MSGGDQFIKPDQVGMRDSRQRAEFLLEPIKSRRIDALQSLERDQFSAFAIVGLEDNPHASVPQFIEDLVVAYRRQGDGSRRRCRRNFSTREFLRRAVE